MADLIQEALMLIQKAQAYTDSPDIERIEQRRHQRLSEAAVKGIAAKRKHKSPYKKSRKYCRHCGKFKQCSGLRCPDCSKPLRLKARNKHAKKN